MTSLPGAPASPAGAPPADPTADPAAVPAADRDPASGRDPAAEGAPAAGDPAPARVVLRRFLVSRLPDFCWLLERRMTVAWWGLGEGWVLSVQQHHSGPGPLSVAAVQRVADEGAATFRFVLPEERVSASRAELLLADLMGSAAACRLEKTRRGCMLAGVWWEFDEFHGPLEGLLLAGSERASSSEPWITAGWLGREVTADAAYDERTLAGGAGRH